MKFARNSPTRVTGTLQSAGCSQYMLRCNCVCTCLDLIRLSDRWRKATGPGDQRKLRVWELLGIGRCDIHAVWLPARSHVVGCIQLSCWNWCVRIFLSLVARGIGTGFNTVPLRYSNTGTQVEDPIAFSAIEQFDQWKVHCCPQSTREVEQELGSRWETKYTRSPGGLLESACPCIDVAHKWHLPESVWYVFVAAMYLAFTRM